MNIQMHYAIRDVYNDCDDGNVVMLRLICIQQNKFKHGMADCRGDWFLLQQMKQNLCKGELLW